MKFVQDHVNELKGGWLMFWLTFIVLIGCGGEKALFKEKPYEVSYNTPAYIAIQDTPKVKHPRTKTIYEDVVFQKRLLKLMESIESGSTDMQEIRKLNIALQKQMLITIGRATKRAIKNDSLNVNNKVLLEALIGVRDTLNRSNQRANIYYKLAKDADHYQEQAKQNEKASDWYFYTGLVLLFLLFLINVWYSWKNSHNRNKPIYS